jgi:hypothetical protein
MERGARSCRAHARLIGPEHTLSGKRKKEALHNNDPQPTSQPASNLDRALNRVEPKS